LRLAYFERFRPICPACRAARRDPGALVIGVAIREEGGDLVEGILHCPTCWTEFPVLDGVPIVVPDPRRYVAEYVGSLLEREDLSPTIQGLLSDCAGPDSGYVHGRRYLSNYAGSHYGENSAISSLLAACVAQLSAPPTGLFIDIGCATGGATFDLANRTGDLALGIDLNFSFVRFARRLADHGRATWPRRKIGVVYEPAEAAVDDNARHRVEFWVCDAAALPFPDGLFDGACALNTLDSVEIPVHMLAETGRILAGGAEAVFATPYDWLKTVTEPFRWIGGHSQRSFTGGDPAAEMRRILSDESPPEMEISLRLVRERDDVPWRVEMHDRATVEYRTHVVVARKPESASG
jgi:SAM-dependent methyltransferase